MLVKGVLEDVRQLLLVCSCVEDKGICARVLVDSALCARSSEKCPFGICLAVSSISAANEKGEKPYSVSLDPANLKRGRMKIGRPLIMKKLMFAESFTIRQKECFPAPNPSPSLLVHLDTPKFGFM